MSDQKISIKINNKDCLVADGSSILEAASAAGIDIPNLCHHPDFCVKANCRVCVVEIKGKRNLLPACREKVAEGMEIFTQSERVLLARKTNLALIYAEHIEKCADCIWRFECKLLRYAAENKITLTTFADRKGKRQLYKFANAVEIDGTQCIDCRNCLSACSDLQNIHYLELKGKGIGQEIVPTAKKNHFCILCGQCALHCPVSAAQEQAEWRQVEEKISQPENIVVGQISAMVQASLGEDFEQADALLPAPQLFAALRALGFKYIFDTDAGGAVSAGQNAELWIKRLASGENLPLINADCGGAVNYFEKIRPDFLPQLSKIASPHIQAGRLIKSHWAEKSGIDPKKITVVSIMPCTAKKYEAKRPENKVNGLFSVDQVLTYRELTFMLKKKNINPFKLKPANADDVIEAGKKINRLKASGRPIDAIVAKAQALDGLAFMGDLEFLPVPELSNVFEGRVAIAGKERRIAIVKGIKDVALALKRFSAYDYLDIYACPDACIGGGGQPIPTTEAIRRKRFKLLSALKKDENNDLVVNIAAEGFTL